MKHLALTIIVLFLILCWSCDSGVVVNYYDNGLVREQGQLRDGLPIGTWIEYDSDGDTLEVKKFNQASKISQISYYQNGVLDYRANFNDGIENRIYFYPTGSIFCKSTRIDGRKNGLETCFYRGGQIETKVFYLNDSPNGRYE